MVNVSARAAAALEQAQGNRELAAQLFRQWLNEDADLLRELTAPLIDGAVWAAIRQAARAWRAAAWNDGPSTITGQQPRSVLGLQAMAETQAHALLDTFLLHSGVRLGDATVADLQDAIEFHRKQAAGNAAKARFLGLVLSAMGTAERVRDALDETRVRRLRDRAKVRKPVKAVA